MSAAPRSNGILDLEGRIGLVTGAGQGVGRETALHFARSGAAGVVVNDFYSERAAAVAAEVEALGVPALAARADVTEFASVTAMFGRAQERFGRVDLLVNNAGNAGADPRAVSRKPFWEQEPADWGPFMKVNLYGVLHCVRAALPGMIERGYGRIVLVASIAGKEGNPMAAAYSASKAAVIAMTKAIGKDVAGTGVLVNCIAPAVIETPILAGLSQHHIDYMVERIPLGRMGQADEVAALACFLASEDLSFSTGATYDISGGRAVY
jgi:3-oxoacyl-[acyl-carrier protein] reductase